MKQIKHKVSKVWAVSSMITGILGTALFLMPYFSLPLSIMAIVFYTKQKESAMSKAGLVLGIIGTVLGAIMGIALLLILFVASAFA